MKQISRKNFLKLGLASGIILSVPQILSGCSSFSNRREEYEREDVLDPIFLSSSLAPILKAIRIGISAPNPHNVQPWKFRILNDQSALLYVDEKRLLKDTDPTIRQIHIGQGTFLEILSLGSSTFGYKADISIFPEGRYTVDDVGRKPVAKIILRKQNSISPEPLSQFISERITKRVLYEGPELSEQDFFRIRTDATVRYSELAFPSKSQWEKLKRQFISAMKVETYLYKTYEETRIWFRYDDAEAATKKDGLSLRGNGVSGIKNFFARNFFLTPGEEIWHSESNRKAGLDMFAEQVQTSKGFASLKTNRNEVLDWVQVGRDYARLHLAVTKNGFSMHPLSQILQEYPEMDSLRKEFESDLRPGEKIQMIVRLGKSDYRYFSPRRKIEDLIIS